MDSAVRFLQNTRVQQRSLSDRISFLRSKGLTEEEIKLARKRCGLLDETNDKPSVSTVIADQASSWMGI